MTDGTLRAGWPVYARHAPDGKPAPRAPAVGRVTRRRSVPAALPPTLVPVPPPGLTGRPVVVSTPAGQAGNGAGEQDRAPGQHDPDRPVVAVAPAHHGGEPDRIYDQRHC